MPWGIPFGTEYARKGAEPNRDRTNLAGNHDTMHWTTARHFSDHLANVDGVTVLFFAILRSTARSFRRNL
jgi:hypothetical protein